MKKNKGLKIAIIIIVVWVVLVIAAFALLFFLTDLFKSDKQLFSKYALSMGEEKTAFVPASIEDYTNRKASTPYENNGSFTVNIAASNTNSSDITTTESAETQINNMLSYGNNTRINFSGKTDNLNNRTEQDINIFYTNDVSLPFKYKQVEDIYALQADFVLPNYIGIENNNIPELLQKFGINTTSLQLPSKIEFNEIQSLKLTDEEIAHLTANYLTPTLENLSDDKFSKNENSDGSISYTLTLSYEDIKNIDVQILQTLSQDTVVINKINGIYQKISGTTNTILTAENINNVVSNLQAQVIEDGSVDFTITQLDGKVNKIALKMSGLNNTGISSNTGVNNLDSTGLTTSATTEEDDTIELEIAISKNENNSNLTYNFDITAQTTDEYLTFGIETSYTNINTDSVAENYNISAGFNDSVNLEYNFSNNVSFKDSVAIEDFDLNNTIVLNNYSDTEVQTFVSQLGTIIEQKNSSQMQEIGYPTALVNPMFMWVMGPTLSTYIYNAASSTIGDTSLEQQAAAVYNSGFLAYEGNIQGSQARTLINTIETHNQEYANDVSKQIQITSETYTDGSTVSAPTTSTVQNTVPAILTDKTYTVTFAYEPTTGYITACGIVEQGNSNSNSNSTNVTNVTNTLVNSINATTNT